MEFEFTKTYVVRNVTSGEETSVTNLRALVSAMYDATKDFQPYRYTNISNTENYFLSMGNMMCTGDFGDVCQIFTAQPEVTWGDVT